MPPVLFTRCIHIEDLPRQFDSGTLEFANLSQISQEIIEAAYFFHLSNTGDYGPFPYQFPYPNDGGWQYPMIGPSDGNLFLVANYLLPRNVRGGLWRIDVSITSGSTSAPDPLPAPPYYFAAIEMGLGGIFPRTPPAAGVYIMAHGVNELGETVNTDIPSSILADIPDFMGSDVCQCFGREWPVIGLTRLLPGQFTSWKFRITGRWLSDSLP